MKRLWVVECRFKDGKWDICDLTNYKFAFLDFYDTHKEKREIQRYFYEVGSKHWTKKRFRVREYIPRKLK